MATTKHPLQKHTTQKKTQFVSTVAMGAARAMASEEQTSQNPCPTWNSRDQFRCGLPFACVRGIVGDDGRYRNVTFCHDHSHLPCTIITHRLFRRTSGRAPFMNWDANYLLSCGSEVDGGGVKGNLVAVVTGALGLVPTNNPPISRLHYPNHTTSTTHTQARFPPPPAASGRRHSSPTLLNTKAATCRCRATIYRFRVCLVFVGWWWCCCSYACLRASITSTRMN